MLRKLKGWHVCTSYVTSLRSRRNAGVSNEVFLHVRKFRQLKGRNYYSESSSREYAAVNAHVKMLIKHIREANINKYSKDSDCCDVCDAVQPSSSWTQMDKSVQTVVGSWKTWMGWRVRAAGKTVFALCKSSKILIWIMSQIRGIYHLDCIANPKTTTAFTDGWTCLRITEPLPLLPEVYTSFTHGNLHFCKVLAHTVFHYSFYEKHNTVPFRKVYCLR